MQPRLTCFYGDQGVAYRYSGKTSQATPWGDVPALREALAARVGGKVGAGKFFNCVLGNLYRDGCDYMGWHSGKG
ncbi:unnamed protein product [Discosporangium mesarthrocarpum]